MRNLTIRGIKREEFSAEEMDNARNNNLELKQSIVFSTARNISDEHTIQVGDTDLVEFIFEDDTSWTGGADIIHDLFPQAARTNRSGEAFVVPMSLEADSSDRGLGTIALKLLNVFAKKAVAKKVIDLAASLEKKALNNQSGVFGIDPGFHLGKWKITETARPNLLFIHGTNSSTWGSFAEIRDSVLWKHMQDTYGGNIFGLQHETMTKSPIQNVIALFKELPQTCTLHVITHSRGGLVGDVLARFSNGHKGFSEEEIAYLQKTNRKTDVDDIRALQKLAAGKNIRIEKFIRVACPAYGTTILSKRLDHFLNISCNLLSLAGGAAAVIGSELKALIAAAVDTKNDPNELPGLEAMNPDSPFLKVLNNPANVLADSPLTVISGNCGMKFNLKALLIIASKLFYLQDNDLVVDTRSMYCGARRKEKIRYFFDEGPEVDHVHYFQNKNTQEAMLAALKAVGSIPGFTDMLPAEERTAQRNAILGLDGGDVFYHEVSGKKPIVLLLPGIMGSNLEANSKKIWINYIRFLTGELTRLDIAKPNIKAVSLIKTSYRKLANHLRDYGHDVITFPFDWRKPLADAAAELNACIVDILKHKQPIRIIGHSMGGVVTRDFIINHPSTWQKLNASPGFRLLFLGSPLGGSYRIPYVLAGKDSIINQLSKIDLAHTKKELLDMFRKYPGLLGLLPTAATPHDFADPKTWEAMKNASVFDWSIPGKSDLQFFGAYRDKVVQAMGGIDFSKAVYVAGKDDATVCDFEINENLPGEKIIFKSTAEGDQSVTWASGIPVNLDKDKNLYYVPVTHGALANEPDMFKGITEILATGTTELFSRDKPVTRAGTAVFDTMEERVMDTDEVSLENTLLGIKPRRKQEAVKKGRMPVKVSVSNGDLYYSAYPVLVGHFLTDGITSAEAIIDRYCDNTLREWHRLNLYPGDIGTGEVFINTGKDFRGAVVIGLGAPGRLSGFQLARSVEQGAIKYLLELKKTRAGDAGKAEARDTGISVLLIGCGYGGLSIESSVRSILQGVQNANNKIGSLNQEGLRSIEHIEFVELYEDRSLQCLLVLNKIAGEEDGLDIRMADRQMKKLLGSRTRIPMDNASDWWSRISIALQREKNEETGAVDTALRFSSSTGSAREEQRDLQSNPVIVNRLIEDMSVKNRWSADLAKTVFELMIPNDFKDDIKKQPNTMWVLDTAAAAYPWELLQDSMTNARPICCTSGMIRQLQTDKYRLKINAASGNKVLVVGDPELNGSRLAPQLPGALEEAKRVAELLGEHGYEMPNNCMRKQASQIVQAVFKDEYRIMHLAGHGIFNEKDPDRSGMLIGDGIFLSTREICQMSKVPDLVFVNCCYLGKVSGQAEETMSNRYKLAANIGTQLIMNGVKVVIAAGWAVDDANALLFAKRFYTEMLRGEEFGKAIQTARAEAFKASNGKDNTWGAYQCYGDPFFKLTNIPRPAQAKTYQRQYKFLIAQEAEVELSNLISKADTKSYSVAALEKDLEQIIAAVDKAGIRNSSILEKEATAYAELNNYEKAIAKFEDLLDEEKATFTVRALERYCNIRAKLCVKNWKAGKNRKAQLVAIGKVIDDINRLNAMSPTAERYSLLGSAYKRKALILTVKKDKLSSISRAADYYRMAHRLPGNRKRVHTLSNWLEMECILVDAGKKKWPAHASKTGTMPTLKDARQELLDMITGKALEDNSTDFLAEISLANAQCCLWLLDGKNSAGLNEKILLAHYTSAWRQSGSQNKKMADIEHLDFLIDAYSDLVKKPVVLKTLRYIKSGLKDFLR